MFYIYGIAVTQGLLNKMEILGLRVCEDFGLQLKIPDHTKNRKQGY